MKKIFSTVMLALAMSAGVSAENAATAPSETLTARQLRASMCLQRATSQHAPASRTLSSASSCIGDFTVCSLPASGR